MPIKRCKKNGRPGFRSGDCGTCYTYTAGNATSRKRARRRAEAQERAECEKSHRKRV